MGASGASWVDHHQGHQFQPKFNRNLHHRKFPHRSVGRNHAGEYGHQHNFEMSSNLQNTFNAYVDIMGDEGEEYEFNTFCEVLADDVWAYSNTL